MFSSEIHIELSKGIRSVIPFGFTSKHDWFVRFYSETISFIYRNRLKHCTIRE